LNGKGHRKVNRPLIDKIIKNEESKENLQVRKSLNRIVAQIEKLNLGVTTQLRRNGLQK
jgi:ribosomal protein L18